MFPYLDIINGWVSSVPEDKGKLELGQVNSLVEYRNLHLNFGRATGKTTALIQFIREHEDAVFIGLNPCFCSFLCTEYKDLTHRIFPEKTFSLMLQTREDSPIRNAKFFLFDEPGFYFTKKFNNNLLDNLESNTFKVKYIIKAGS